MNVQRFEPHSVKIANNVFGQKTGCSNGRRQLQVYVVLSDLLARATRCVCEKIAQTEAQPIFGQN
jgi:hypothetical protein